MTAGRALDQRLAARLARLLARTPLTPNLVTTISLLAGLAAAGAFASGARAPTAAGGLLFMLACLLDHVDGELARLTGRTSTFGHYYDRATAGAVYVATFLGIGIGQADGALGGWAAALGLSAGVSIGLIFVLRNETERRHGKDSIKQRVIAGFEIEDLLYLVGPIAWLGWLAPLIAAAGIGAPLYLLASLFLGRRRALW